MVESWRSLPHKKMLEFDLPPGIRTRDLIPCLYLVQPRMSIGGEPSIYIFGEHWSAWFLNKRRRHLRVALVWLVLCLAFPACLYLIGFQSVVCGFRLRTNPTVLASSRGVGAMALLLF